MSWTQMLTIKKNKNVSLFSAGNLWTKWKITCVIDSRRHFATNWRNERIKEIAHRNSKRAMRKSWKAKWGKQTEQMHIKRVRKGFYCTLTIELVFYKSQPRRMRWKMMESKKDPSSVTRIEKKVQDLILHCAPSMESISCFVFAKILIGIMNLEKSKLLQRDTHLPISTNVQTRTHTGARMLDSDLIHSSNPRLRPVCLRVNGS